MSLAETVQLIESVVADLGSCTEGERVEALAATERVRSALAAHAATLMVACDHRQDWAADGAATPGVWAAKVCDQPVAEGRRLVRQARRLEAMPATAAAFAAGELGEAKVTMLVAARIDRLADEFDRCEGTLVDATKVLDPDHLATVLRRWRQVAHDAVDRDPSTVGSHAEPEFRSSAVFLSGTMAGRYVLAGDLSAEDGAILAHGIEVATRSLFHRGARLCDGAELDPAQRRAVGLVETFKRGITADADRAGAQPLVLATVDLGLLTRRAERAALRALDESLADLEPHAAAGAGLPRQGRVDEPDPPGADEERELTAARVDTLVAERCAHRGQPPPRAWRPQPAPPPTNHADRPGGGAADLAVADRTGAPRLRQIGPSSPPLPGPAGPSDPFDIAGLDLVPAPDPTDPFDLGRCEIPGAGPIPVEMARRLACNGRIARLVLGADRTILDLGHLVRLATPEQRRALVARDRGCVFPGCDHGPGWCEAHHLDFFVDDHGPTDLVNLALVCSHHHHLVHDDHWILERTPTGWVAASPAGRRLHRATPI